MDHDVLKSYSGIQNVIFRIEGVNTTTTLEGDRIKNALLLNSHIDSALPSKGSAEYVIFRVPQEIQMSLLIIHNSFDNSIATALR